MKKEIICGIYKITSPCGKIYIGKSVGIYGRWKDYRNRPCLKQPRLHRSFLKYGVKNHKFEIVEKCSKEELNDKEIYYIKFFDCFDNPNGLNLKAGGDGGGDWSKESREKASAWQQGRTLPKEHSLKIGEGNKRAWAKLSPEEKKQRLSTSGIAKAVVSEEQKNKTTIAIRLWHKNNKKPPVSEETKKKYSETTKNTWKVNREKMIASQTGVKKNPKSKVNYSEAAKKSHRDNPESYLHTEERIKKASERTKGEKNPMYGKHHTEESKLKNKESQRIAYERIRQEKLTMIF